MSELHLWSFGPDMVIAADAVDVLAIMRDQVGNDGLEDYAGDTPYTLDDNESLTIWDEDCSTKITKLASEWAEMGRGWLCSTEF